MPVSIIYNNNRYNTTYLIFICNQWRPYKLTKNRGRKRDNLIHDFTSSAGVPNYNYL